MLKKTGWVLFVFFAITIGIYPAIYLLTAMQQGLLSTKPAELLANGFWKFQFYQHIIFGGISLLAGWSQFSKQLRSRKQSLHRLLGKLYFASVILSGFAGLYLSFFATGGIIASMGFGCLAVGWIASTLIAYRAIKNKEVTKHEHWMMRSYALAFAAVTLRIYLPLFQFGFGMNFINAYLIIAWLCWVPNLIVSEWMISILKKKPLGANN